jgi:DNA-directed RNA polymerase subunit alpha
MEDLLLPKKIEYKKGANANEGQLIIEACHPGYGVTIGNALRRVLLSSLVGGAVTGIKIKGISHEFSTIPNIKEDAVEIILNLKKLRLKVNSLEPVVLKLKAKGKKTVKASDIEKNSAVEIGNPDLVLATLTSSDAEIDMEIYVAQGRGYVPTEEKEKNNEGVGVISIDSLFTPVVNVGLKVENVRVGQMTNYDKLIMDITTDGTITPQEAVEQSSKILIDHFKLLAGEETVDEVGNEDKKETKKTKKK